MVEGTALETRHGRNSIESSNLSVSAGIKICYPKGSHFLFSGDEQANDFACVRDLKILSIFIKLLNFINTKGVPKL